MAKNRVEVTINSRQYAILADESDEYIKKLAKHIDEKVKLVIKGGQNVMGERPIVLAALNICDEYYKCEEAGRVLQRQLASCNDKLDRAKAEVQRLKSAPQQISFDEQEAEEKLAQAEEHLTRTREKLARAEERIKMLEAKQGNLETKSDFSANQERIKPVSKNNYNKYGKKN